MLAIRVFGTLEIADGTRVLGPRDLGGVRPKQLLEILLTARGRLVPVDRIAEAIWSDRQPDDIAASIQTFVSVLRRKLVADRDTARQLVVTEAEAYRFATDAVNLDLDRFDELLERSAGEPTRTARRFLEQALSLVRGDVLEDEPYALWAQDLRGSYRGRILGARLDAADAALAERDSAAALVHAEAAVALDPFSERAERLQMLALYALDRTHEALARYRDYRMRLDEQLGLEPSAETRALESAVIRQEDIDALLPRPIERASTKVDAFPSRLVGRRDELDAVMQTIRHGVDANLTLIQIEGVTGIGKTRLLEEVHDRLEQRVGRATCSPLERHLHYVPLAAALREATGELDLDCRRLPALQQVMPELAVDAPKSTVDELDVLEALVTLLGEHAPVILLVDDVHFCDHRTLSALSYLRRRGAFAGAIVTTALPTDTSVGSPPHRLHADLRLQLEPLTQAELSAAGIADLYESSAGDPRLVAEALACGRGAPPSKTLTEALLRQCRAAGDWAFRVLINASVLEQPFEPDRLAALLGVTPTDLIEELERLCERRILRIDGLRFRFRNDLVRDVLFESISPARQELLRRQSDRSGVSQRSSRSAGYALRLEAS